ncbi:hypothetical protein CEH78_003729 [Salmonella enterica]|nr:hypothetical protein [Salmonella enterica]
MSIPVQTPFNLYIANGSTTVFPYRFLLNQASDLRVTADGKKVTYGFNVSGEGNPSGGQITFSLPPASGTKIAIIRNIPLRRDTEYQDNGDLLASTINADFDRLWMAVQGVDAVKDLALSRTGQDVDHYDAQGRQVKNLKDPVDPQDAATKGTLDAAVTRMGQQVQDAKTHLDVVGQSVSQNAVAAKQSEANAATSEQNASQLLLKTQAAAGAAATTAAAETAALLKKEVNDNVNHVTQLATAAETASSNAGNSAAAAAASEKASAASALRAEQAAGTAAADAVAQAVPAAANLIRNEIQAEATKAESSATAAAASEVNAATSARESEAALKAAQLIAKTPGKSAYEIWAEQQPADSDTSMTAYLEYQKGQAALVTVPTVGDDYIPRFSVGDYALGHSRTGGVPPGTVIPGSSFFILSDDGHNPSLDGTWVSMGYVASAESTAGTIGYYTDMVFSELNLPQLHDPQAVSDRSVLYRYWGSGDPGPVALFRRIA